VVIGSVDANADSVEYRVSIDGGSTFGSWIDTTGNLSFFESDGANGLTSSGGNTVVVEARVKRISPADTSSVVSDSQVLPTFGTPSGVSVAPVADSVDLEISFTNAGASLGYSPSGVAIQRDPDNDGGFTQFVDNYAGASPYTDGGLDGGRTYGYRVFSTWTAGTAPGTGNEYYSAGFGAGSATVELEAFGILTRDEAGTSDGVEVAVDGANLPTNQTVQDYRVYYRVGSSMAGNPTAYTLLGTFTPANIEDVYQVIDGLSLSDVVYIQAQARNTESVAFAESAEETVTVTAPALDAPTVTDEGYKNVAEDFVWVNWNAVTGATGYDVEVRSRDDAPGTWGAWGEPSCTNGLGSATDVDPETEGAITAARDFQFRVRATNAGGASGWTESAIITGSMTGGTPTTEPGDCL